ncbi:MAG: hypothetical protein LUQ44_04205, partial [Methanothrix sp.]|nr:hypothetical protein [Methanothrix sp.]
MSSVAWSQDNGEGWYLQGEPVITKDKEIDLPPCYTGRTVTVTNGEGHGSQTFSAECFKEGSGTYSSDVTWTPPPAYMKPGSTISFSMTFTSPDENPTSGSIKANGVTIVEGSSRNPKGKSTAAYTVPGFEDDKLEINTSFIMISGLHGYVSCEYKYERPDPRSSKTFDPESLKSISGLHLSNAIGEVHVIRDGLEIPAYSGFQLREGDTVKVLDDSQVKILTDSKDCWWDVIALGKIMKITIPTKEVLKKMELEKKNQKWAAYLGTRHGLVLCNTFPVSEAEHQKSTKMKIKYCTIEDKHTSFACLQTSNASIILVLNGSVKVTSNITGEEIFVNEGQIVTATASGLSPLESFDVEAVKAILEPYLPTTEVTVPKKSKVIYNSWNLGYVDNNPTCSPFFTTAEPQTITYIDTYHWNYGAGAPGGTIRLRNGHGMLYGPWEAESAIDQGEVPKGYWIAHPNEVIPAGTYIVEDSDPATWSKNSESPCGFTKVEGYAATADASEETGDFATGIKEPVSSAISTRDESNPPVETETEDTAIEGKKGSGSSAHGATDDEEPLPDNYMELAKYKLEKEATAAKQEHASIKESTYSIVSAKPLAIRGQVATGDFEWNPQNFAGFYYDLDRDVGTEVLTAALKDRKLSGSYPYGLTYQTTAEENDLAFED